MDAAREKGRSVTYAKGFSMENDAMTEQELEKALRTAAEADVAVIFAGLPEIFESEGYDRTSMKLPKCQDRLIEEVLKVQPNVVVVLHNGSPVELPWACLLYTSLQDGCFYNENLRTALSEYIYVSDGTEKVITPHFTYYGYRYVKVTGVRAVSYTHLDVYKRQDQNHLPGF